MFTQLQFDAPASAYIESLLDSEYWPQGELARTLSQVCPVHPGTTGRPCPVCQIIDSETAHEAADHWTCDCKACQAEHARIIHAPTPRREEGAA